MPRLYFDKNIKEMKKEFGLIDESFLSKYEKNILTEIDKEINDLKTKNNNDSIDADYIINTNEVKLESIKTSNNVDDLLKKLADNKDEFVTENNEKINELNTNISLSKTNLSSMDEALIIQKDEDKKAVAAHKAAQDAYDKQDKLIKSIETKSLEKYKALDDKLEKDKASYTKKINDNRIKYDKIEVEIQALVVKGNEKSNEAMNFKEGSKEFNKKMEEYRKIKAQIEKAEANKTEIEKETLKFSSEIQAINIKYSNDKDLLDEEKENNAEALNNEKAKLEQLKVELDKATKKIDDVKKEKTDIEKNKEIIANQISQYETEIEDIKTANVNYAKELKEKESKTIEDDILKAKQYKIIKKAVSNKTPSIDADRAMKGIKLVENAYNSYKSHHNLFARAILRYIPGTSAHADYAEFNKVRDTYSRITGVRVTYINKFLDEGVQEGDLYNVLEGKDAILGKGIGIKAYKEDFTKDENFGISEYLLDLERCANEKLKEEIDVNEAEKLLAIDDGIKMLNALGDLDRKNPEVTSISSLISNISEKIEKIAYGPRKDTIAREIENALKPENERETITISYDEETKEDIEILNQIKQRNEINHQNVILTFNDEIDVKDTIFEENNVETKVQVKIEDDYINNVFSVDKENKVYSENEIIINNEEKEIGQ